MLDKTAVGFMTDEEISKAIDPLASEASRRELEASRFRKASLAKSSERDPRCPVCHAPLAKDGKRGDGVPRYECPSCHRHYSDSSHTSLSSSKLPPKKIREILTLIVLDCPDWVAAEIAGVNVKNRPVLGGPMPRRKPKMGDGIKAFRARLDR